MIAFLPPQTKAIPPFRVQVTMTAVLRGIKACFLFGYDRREQMNQYKVAIVEAKAKRGTQLLSKILMEQAIIADTREPLDTDTIPPRSIP